MIKKKTTQKRKNYIDYREWLLEKLKDQELAIEYLNEALKDPDQRMWMVALRNVLEAQGGDMAEVAKRAHITRQSLYRMLSAKGNPQLKNFAAVCNTLGYDVQLSPKK